MSKQPASITNVNAAPDIPALSVVIPVSDDPAILGCVQSLLDCIGDLTIEILIVLNGASALYTNALRQTFKDEQCVRILDLPFQSIPGARNLGLRSARSESVLMFDSDCRPVRSDYLTAMCAALNKAPVVVGAVRFRSESSTITSKAYAALRQHDYDLHQVRRAYTPNFALRSTVVDRIGVYDERLLRGEDADLGYRLLDAGYLPHKVSAAAVYHWQCAELWTVLWTWYQYGRGKGAQMRKRGWRIRNLIPALIYLAAPLGGYFRAVGGVWQTLLLRPILVIAFQAGCVRELLRMRDRQR